MLIINRASIDDTVKMARKTKWRRTCNYQWRKNLKIYVFTTAVKVIFCSWIIIGSFEHLNSKKPSRQKYIESFPIIKIFCVIRPDRLAWIVRKFRNQKNLPHSMRFYCLRQFLSIFVLVKSLHNHIKPAFALSLYTELLLLSNCSIQAVTKLDRQNITIDSWDDFKSIWQVYQVHAKGATMP